MTTRRGTRSIVLWVILALAGWLAVMIWIALQPERAEGKLGIDDETPDGAAAITSVLADHGVTVRPAQSLTQLRSELSAAPEATVLLHDKSDALSSASYQRLEELADLVPADQRVFAGVPGAHHSELLDGVEGTQSVGYIDKLEVEAQCRLEAAREAGDVSGFRQGLIVSEATQGCFGVMDPSSTAAETAYAFAQTDPGAIFFADWRMLSNAGLRDNGTATLATWSLGRTDTVIWFQPDFQFDPDADGKLSAVQLPDWARMGLVWAVIVTGFYLMARGRRTGPVITEPLPTEVSPAETTVGRGRLYARAKHHRHALEILQRASLARIARLLQLGAQSSPEVILAETAQQLNLPLADLRALYRVPEHLTDQTLVVAATQLHDLEHRVRDRFSAPAKES